MACMNCIDDLYEDVFDKIRPPSVRLALRNVAEHIATRAIIRHEVYVWAVLYDLVELQNMRLAREDLMGSDLVLLESRMAALRFCLQHNFDGILCRVGVAGGRRGIKVYGPVDDTVTALS